MNKALFGIPNMDIYLVMGILVFFLIMEVISGYWKKSQRTSSDWIQELGGFLVLGLMSKPLIVLLAIYLFSSLLPSFSYILSENSLWLMLPLFLLVDDFLQYWYHRLAHEYPFLWKLHRSHHQAEEMGFFVSYRNAWLYYLIMPNIWWLGLFTLLGGAKAMVIGVVLKQIIVIGAHSNIHWDEFLYKRKWLNPLASVLERIFITPAFHHAHHGKSKLDGISNPNGNFGNMFSIWDQLFGTASFSHQFSNDYGLPNDSKDHWTASYFYPIVTSDIEGSELAKGFKKKKTTTLEPTKIHLEKGAKYLWCQCGMSQNQPFCDGMHHGTKMKPLLFEAKRTGEASICNCKLTKSGPFCDNSHLM
jgi:sterol desaturase/sphingolipid hydroxylase (fatty acid hydroxylase superfamily)/CDGSH-type Zn-finger protein